MFIVQIKLEQKRNSLTRQCYYLCHQLEDGGMEIIMKTDLKSPKSIDTDFLKIRGNCLEIQNITIQLSNISLLSTTDITPNRFPMLSIALILVGLIFLQLASIPALIVIFCSVVWILEWYSSVEEVKRMKRLTIITNSGNVFPIVFKDQAFLTKVVTVMTDIIRDPARAHNITINVKECTFSNDSSVVENIYE